MSLSKLVLAPANSTDDADGARSFAVALSELKGFLFARSLSLSCNRELAEDLVQETLANAWQARRSFTPGTNLKAWLSTILRNEFYSHKRRAWRNAPWSDTFDKTLPSPPGAQQATVDLCEAACAMNGLPDLQRQSLLLVGVHGFSYEETALILRVKLGTIKSRVARARITLLGILDTQKANQIELRPANRDAFNEWLVQVDLLGLLARQILETGEFHDMVNVPKIKVRPAAVSNGGHSGTVKRVEVTIKVLKADALPVVTPSDMALRHGTIVNDLTVPGHAKPPTKMMQPVNA